MEEVYQKIIQAFIDKAAWFTAAGLKPPKFIDFYLGQPEDPESYEFVLPALFIDYSTTWIKEGRLYVGDTNFSIHAIPEVFPNTSNISTNIPAGLKTLTWYRLVRQVLDTVTSECFPDLLRGTENPAYTNDYKYHILAYSTKIDEESGKEIQRFSDGTIEDISISGNIIAQTFSL